MRVTLRGSIAGFCLAALALQGGCEPPPSAGPVGAAVVPPPPAREESLPAAVAATVARLREIAATGTYRDLARLADETPGFRSNVAGMSHAEYWYLKMRTGDWPMAQAETLLTYRHAVAESARGKVYIWPWMALLAPGDITPQAERDIVRLLGAEPLDELRRGGMWPGYVLGIAEDGTWLYFVSGSG